MTSLTARQRSAVATLREFVDRNPLAGANLWHTPAPGTSQREAVRAALTPDLLVAVILGGNRSGKSEVGAMLSVLFALGSHDAAVKIFAKRNQLTDVIGTIPARPGLVCCSALTGNDSIRVLREKVSTYLPAGTEWSNRYGHGEATARLPGGGMIIFKSNDQKARAFQGADWDFLLLDEEHEQPVFNEARMRLVDRAGRACFTMTPLKGKTWVWSRFVHDREPGSAVYALNSRDNPYVPQDYLEALLAKYGPHERAARERGEFTALEGRVYEFSRALHVIDPAPVPDGAGIYVGVDFGVRNPFAAVFAYVDDDDRVIVFDLWYRAGLTISRHAEAIKDILNGRTPEWIVADPEDKASRLALARDHGIANVPAKKGPGSVRAGISAVAERLSLSADGSPGLLIMSNCRDLIDEFEGYVWAEHRDGEPVDKPKARSQDHALDALRYLITRLGSASFGVG